MADVSRAIRVWLFSETSHSSLNRLCSCSDVQCTCYGCFCTSSRQSTSRAYSGAGLGRRGPYFHVIVYSTAGQDKIRGMWLDAVYLKGATIHHQPAVQGGICIYSRAPHALHKNDILYLSRRG
jgi:hypothetical protein